jgi:ribosomal protein L37AE/L43A
MSKLRDSINGHDAMKERLSRIAQKDAKERHCPKCKRDNALRKDFEGGRFVYKCRWADCRHTLSES